MNRLWQIMTVDDVMIYIVISVYEVSWSILLSFYILSVVVVYCQSIDVQPKNTIQFTDLPRDCIFSILNYLPQSDICSISLVNKELNGVAKVKLYHKIFITCRARRYPRLNTFVTDGIIDDSSNWTFVNPYKFWKFLNLYHLDTSLVGTIRIFFVYSNDFIEKLLVKFPNANIILEMEGNYQLDNLRIVKSIIDIGSHISNMLSKSLVELTLCGDTSNDIPEFPSFENLRKLNLQGNPINLLMHFPNLEGLKSLSLTFEGDPTTFNFTPPCFPMDTVEEFQLRFNSTYICKERPTLLLEINTFLESLEFPNLRGLSISSTDLRRGNSFKSILPAFNEFIFKVPYLSALHLSIGCEINFSHLKSILRHKNSLTRLVWIGNLDGNMFDKYRNIKKIRFDMVNGILLNSITDKYSLGESELLYVDCMCDLGKERGDNYFDLESFKICYGESQVNSKLVEYITKEIQTFIDEFKNLRYMVINGIHFNVLPTFDNHCEITSVYD